MKLLWGFIRGLVFGLGVIASGITEPLKRKGFLDITSA